MIYFLELINIVKGNDILEKSKVYFTDFRARPGYNLLQKLEILIKKAGIENINFENKYVAIKIHFGEPGNLAYLRPNYAKVVADVVKELGGKPFLTDCNTLYVGGRKNALDHIDTAYLNGFTPFSTGCNVIIADGLKGTDEAYVDINQEYIKTAKIGRAIMDADVIISLSHFKGHEMTGFGGCFKNIGITGIELAADLFLQGGQLRPGGLHRCPVTPHFGLDIVDLLKFRLQQAVVGTNPHHTPDCDTRRNRNRLNCLAGQRHRFLPGER